MLQTNSLFNKNIFSNVLTYGVSFVIYSTLLNERRLGHYKEASLQTKALKEVNSTALQTAYWEKEVLNTIRQEGLRYIPEKEFGGWTECATLDSKDFLLGLFEEIGRRA